MSDVTGPDDDLTAWEIEGLVHTDIIGRRQMPSIYALGPRCGDFLSKSTQALLRRLRCVLNRLVALATWR